MIVSFPTNPGNRWMMRKKKKNKQNKNKNKNKNPRNNSLRHDTHHGCHLILSLRDAPWKIQQIFLGRNKCVWIGSKIEGIQPRTSVSGSQFHKLRLFLLLVNGFHDRFFHFFFHFFFLFFLFLFIIIRLRVNVVPLAVVDSRLLHSTDESRDTF